MRIFWLGRLVSALGLTATTLVVPFYLAVSLKLDSTSVSLVMTGPLVATLLSPMYAGVLADLVDRKQAAILAESVSFAILGAIAALAFVDVRNIPLLLVLNALLAASGAVFVAAFYAGFPDIVGDERLDSSNARLQTVRTVADSAGGLAGGSLITVLGAGEAPLGALLFVDLGPRPLTFTNVSSRAERLSLTRENVQLIPDDLNAFLLYEQPTPMLGDLTARTEELSAYPAAIISGSVVGVGDLLGRIERLLF
ncbi:MFS transporter [Jatrophihabitans telluris]|uniref:MFS transporter n=2 Tax=Jatrophihabitans telluris TaxID=2038343 RepID=A0ABY4QYR4_9ACTN|nr:MFS transporter [Jatrophihabitans telluris]UQX88257.1 MFS transporter [Jatrophihabitans telluris]